MTKGKTIQRKVVYAQDVILHNTHSSYLFKNLKEAIGYQCIKSIFITFKIQIRSGLKHQAFQITGCHSHPLASKGIYSQLNIKLLGFKYKAKPQHISAKSSELKAFSLLLKD